MMSIDFQIPIPQVQWIEITEDHCEQRLDNFLIARLKGVPKSRIYRIVRKGEVRVNKGRVDVNYRLAVGDVVRIPPIRISESTPRHFVPGLLRDALQNGILYEDDGFLVINKPAGFAVHGGSGVDSGVIEGLRQIRTDAHFLELVHRLDRDTSGCLLIAKKRSMLRKLHELFRDDKVKKKYLALLAGTWGETMRVVNAPLLKNVTLGGERMVIVSPAGKSAETVFKQIKAFRDATLVGAEPKTGRTHQIRVHAASMGYPIVGDDRYGNEEVNRFFKNKGYKRIFLHARQLSFIHPVSGESMIFDAALPQSLENLLAHEKAI